MTTCAHCGNDCVLTGGSEVYPHRKDLYSLYFWICRPCDAFVGCHKNGDGKKALGIAANAELRKLRSRIHAIIDPVWRDGLSTRSKVYADMTVMVNYLKILEGQFHTSWLTKAQAEQVIKALNERSWVKGLR